jgi:hypothetical protein
VKRHLIACLLICAFGAAPIEHETPKLQIFLEGGNGLMTISVFTFDGCEYVLGQHGPGDNPITHKGNCRHCAERQRRERRGERLNSRRIHKSFIE